MAVHEPDFMAGTRHWSPIKMLETNEAHCSVHTHTGLHTINIGGSTGTENKQVQIFHALEFWNSINN